MSHGSPPRTAPSAGRASLHGGGYGSSFVRGRAECRGPGAAGRPGDARSRPSRHRRIPATGVTIGAGTHFRTGRRRPPPPGRTSTPREAAGGTGEVAALYVYVTHGVVQADGGRLREVRRRRGARVDAGGREDQQQPGPHLGRGPGREATPRWGWARSADSPTGRDSHRHDGHVQTNQRDGGRRLGYGLGVALPDGRRRIEGWW
ncbi:hypothetical protein SNL152K_9744 [Streptomyces sp. NL15-2K]|nr:hypothetical protein SNL152K_9744 [Streptomyces sp. NL15-2K]